MREAWVSLGPQSHVPPPTQGRKIKLHDSHGTSMLLPVSTGQGAVSAPACPAAFPEHHHPQREAGGRAGPLPRTSSPCHRSDAAGPAGGRAQDDRDQLGRERASEALGLGCEPDQSYLFMAATSVHKPDQLAGGGDHAHAHEHASVHPFKDRFVGSGVGAEGNSKGFIAGNRLQCRGLQGPGAALNRRHMVTSE